MRASLRSERLPALVLLFFLVTPHGSAASEDRGPFALPEVSVTRAPLGSSRVTCDAPVVAFAVAPDGPLVAILLARPGGAEVVLWPIGSAVPTAPVWRAGASQEARGIAWHPRARRIYVALETGEHGELLAVDLPDPLRAPVPGKRVATFDRPVANVRVGPAPFVTAWADEASEERVEHRLFVTSEEADGTRRVLSVTESGTKPYQVVGPERLATAATDEWLEPSASTAPSATLVAFHPAGQLLVWSDAGGGLHASGYARQSWGESRALALPGGSLAVAPNGAWTIHWREGEDGARLLLGRDAAPRPLAPGVRFAAAPETTPDGRGLVGAGADGRTVLYEPVDIPLADVTNLWMFLAEPRDAALLQANGGVMRPLELEQLYALYESEAYDCGSFDRSTPTRPYLVTTDLFWELFASAYEGLFLVKERTEAIGAFWRLVDAARSGVFAEGSRWPRLLAALDAARRGDRSDPEAALILDAAGSHDSPALGEAFDYGELLPRGHYAADPGLATYFKAFTYLVRLPSTPAERAELAALGPEVQRAARDWIQPYLAFIAPSRAMSMWGGLPPPPAYCRYPVKELRPFPLSWGFDNEAMDAVTYHSGRPDAELIQDAGGDPRLLPSGLDVAAALGSPTARALLAPELARYPNLAAALDALEARRPAPDPRGGLYQRWLDALAVQWAGGLEVPGRPGASPLWEGKRLQTGLASWATLRHATVLVNERGEAECGEGGYEPIVLRPPRGYVEPDPATFEAIAALFDGARALVEGDTRLAGIVVKDEEEREASEALEQGIGKRLAAAAQKTRSFAAMATKERLGDELTDAEQVEILEVARVAEHTFKIFKSLARADLALANPEPMAKVADVYGGSTTSYLLAGVGLPLEWDLVVPFHGRRQVVKGAVYGYRETVAPALLDDAGWLEALPGIPHPAWIEPYLSPSRLACPPPDPF